MSLPKLVAPTYKTTLPLTKKEVTYRPYLTKEEKIMLMAAESDSPEDMISAIVDIIKSCCEGVDNPLDLPECDIEYLFLKLRAASVGEIAAPIFTCGKLDKTSECDGNTIMAIDYSSIEPDLSTQIDPTIILDEKKGIGVTMRFPTLNDIKSIAKRDIKSETKIHFELIKQCIETIFDKESVYPTKDHDDAELTEWVDNLNAEQLKKIVLFLKNVPKLSWKGEAICTKCGKKHEVVLQGMHDFFM